MSIPPKRAFCDTSFFYASLDPKDDMIRPNRYFGIAGNIVLPYTPPETWSWRR